MRGVSLIRLSALFAALTLATPPSLAQGSMADMKHSPRASLETDNTTLQASLDRLYSRSAAWREAVNEVWKTGRRAVLVTPDRVRVADPQTGIVTPFDDGVLAEVQPMPDEDSRVDLVVVVVNLGLLETLHRQRSGRFDADLDRILAHEVYGHAIPYLLAGDLSGKCADPRPGQRASESCAIQRENEVRVQLGLGRRIDDGIEGLAIANRWHH